MSMEGLGKVYGDRQVIVRQGETGDCMYAIQSGRVEVVRETDGGEVRVAVLDEGDIFGEMAIFEKEVRSATVRALGETRVLSIDKRTFLRRVQEDPSLAFNLALMLCKRIRRLNAELASLKQTGAAGTHEGAGARATAGGR
jgi:CRP/FNR family transcriptional regulator, cyclic AMP receptor protein